MTCNNKSIDGFDLCPCFQGTMHLKVIVMIVKFHYVLTLQCYNRCAYHYIMNTEHLTFKSQLILFKIHRKNIK